MGQEQFMGPEYHTDFDPEKFLRDLKNAQAGPSGEAGPEVEAAAVPSAAEEADERGGEGERA
ncbi:hypothetical protein [Corynebacterium sp. UBA2622]|uniref:hypothetical protein n=1 Tax=Corynebacterium sp. UBA2622 TaxID=1946393 RepID=UPI0025BB502F|nr:hypothetical protein [Corynebacterium sp. UBA2622]